MRTNALSVRLLYPRYERNTISGYNTNSSV